MLSLIIPPRLPLIAALLIPSFGCNLPVDISGAEAAVIQFHRRFNSGDYSTIYSETSDEFRSRSSEKDFTRLLAETRRKLGAEQTTAGAGFFVTRSQIGPLVRLNYTTTFAQGEAVERFIFRSEKGKYLLVGYNADSPLLAR